MNDTIRSIITSQDGSNTGSFVNQQLITSNRLNYKKNNTKKNKLNLSILQGKDLKNQIKSISPIKSHLKDLEQGNNIKKTITPIGTKNFKFKRISNYINRSPTIKPKSYFNKALNLNDSKLILKNYNNENIPIIKINYVDKNG